MVRQGRGSQAYRALGIVVRHAPGDTAGAPYGTPGAQKYMAHGTLVKACMARRLVARRRVGHVARARVVQVRASSIV